jgi:hypothetical protein
MKTSQWAITMAVLVILVFGITFMLNYTGDSGEGGPSPQPLPADMDQLVFPIRASTPEPGRYPFELERGNEGHSDFWFYNPNDKPVPVGLNRVACKCSSVEIWIADKSLLNDRAAEASGLVGETAGLTNPWSSLVRVGATEHYGRTNNLESRAQAHTLQQATYEVPVGAIGWVRLRWKNNQSGAQKLDAQLWYHHADLGPKVSLEAYARFHEAFTLGSGSHEYRLPDTPADRLPISGSVVVWSQTRSRLNLQTRAVSLGRRNDSDGFVVEPPQQLSPEEVEQLKAKLVGTPDDGTPIRSAYRIRYTVNSRTSDDKGFFEQGLFHRRVEVSLADESVTSQAFIVQGVILGDVNIEGARDQAVIDLGTFNATIGSPTVNRILYTTVPGLDLELDTKRTGDFLTVKLSNPQSTPDGGKKWTLTTQVEPNKIKGRFGTLSDPDYLDSAVYVRPVGGAGRVLRIPVRGTATQ